MNGLLLALYFILCVCIAVFVPGYGAGAVLIGAIPALAAWYLIRRIDKEFLVQIFLIGLLLRMMVGLTIFLFSAQVFLGTDAKRYDEEGYALLQYWRGNLLSLSTIENVGGVGGGWGMDYLVAGIYALVGRNQLAVQLFDSVFGAATAVVIFLCAQHLYQNLRVARVAAWFIALFPSLVLWSSQMLKDGLIIFLLTMSMLATLKLGEKLSVKYLVVIIASLAGLLSLRFYIFYMVVAAIAGAFIIGMRKITAANFLRQFVIIVVIGLALTYMGVINVAQKQVEVFGSLEAIQRSRLDLAQSAESGFGQDVDVSTTSGAISAIPLGMTYLLFAPFPWEMANLRQSITLPEMLVWWGSFPLLILGLWFTFKYRLRQALPILIFTVMLTLAYSIFQGNVGTAFRQRAQLLVFYFIFVAVGFVLLKERAENRRQQDLLKEEAMRLRRLPVRKA
jgi:4-amino-4-deoxy-L-arabinose transferase-like glycosyltransferase